MVRIVIGINEENQRLDRFLRKYYREAPLSVIYKLIRKDVKVNGRRAKEDTMLLRGDELAVYVSEAEDKSLRGRERERKRVGRQFGIAYEDENILAAEKPFGLLTHGDLREKKQHLANQVIDYLIEKGDYCPRTESTFSPASANRLDRNTTGLVLFGKNSAALQELNAMIRARDCVRKFYLTITAGAIERELYLADRMEKDSQANRVCLADSGGKLMQTIVRPLEVRSGYTLAEVELITGRTHQIRVHLASAGYPIIGDAKYGSRAVNASVAEKYGLTTQLLHAGRIYFNKGTGRLQYLTGKEIRAPLPERAARIKKDIFG